MKSRSKQWLDWYRNGVNLDYVRSNEGQLLQAEVTEHEKIFYGSYV